MVGQLQAVVGEACAALEGVLLDYRSNTKSSG